MKDTNTTLVVGLLAVVIIALGTLLAISVSKTDPVLIVGFAGTILTGLLAFLRAGQAADKATRAVVITEQNATKVQEIKVSVDGRMEQLLEQSKLAAGNSATLAANIAAELKAADLVKVTDANLAAAQAAPAIGAVPGPQEVVIVQPEGAPVPVEMATPIPVKIHEEGKEQGT